MTLTSYITSSQCCSWGAPVWQQPGLSWISYRRTTQSSSWAPEYPVTHMCSATSDRSCYIVVVYRTWGKRAWEHGMRDPDWHHLVNFPTQSIKKGAKCKGLERCSKDSCKKQLKDWFICQQKVVQFSRSVMSNYLWPHELQHARTPCPSPTPGVHSDSRPSSQWCHPAISSSVIPFSSCPQSLPASQYFPMSQLFTWGGQSIGVSALALVLSMNTQDWLL